jgi:DNA invertase Pin-like site-specific DNA recombinase
MGGQCECGESHIAALDFHHLDPNEKEFVVAVLLRTNDWDAIEKELKKCKLVCSNCHRKLHFDANFYEQHRVEIEQRADGIVPLREIKLRRWTDEEVELLVKIYSQGSCWEYIGRKLSRTAGVVKRKVEELIATGKLKKVKRKSERKNPKFVDSTEILRLWNEGKNVTTISSLLEISPSPIYRILRQEGKV